MTDMQRLGQVHTVANSEYIAQVANAMTQGGQM
jgi:hypothetical protein